jgi:hypothetical protein
MVKYISFLGILAIAPILLSDAAIAAREPVEILLEAELANKIQAPIAIDTSEDTKAFDPPVVPDEPSNGKFIWAPGKAVTGGGGSGFAEFIIDIPKAGTYAIWGRVIAWDGNSDSFWVTWEPADPAENPQQTQNTQYRWGVASGGAWQWDRVNHWLDGGTFDRQWEFDKGETKLRIWSREDATMLDCLFITDNLAGDPGSVDARVPTEEDIDLQIHGARGRAVEAAGKLSTTWGRLRSQYR